MENERILLVSNPVHAGIMMVAEAYNRAFEHHGIRFKFLRFHDLPGVSIEEANSMLLWNVTMYEDIKKVILIQPSYLTFPTFQQLLALKKRRDMQFYCINTEDPYSTFVTMAISRLFDIKFTNEKNVAEKCASMGFEYLPMAFDSLQPFLRHEEKKADFAFISTFYEKRLEYLYAMRQLPITKFVSGSIMPILKQTYTKTLDTTDFSLKPGLIAHHKELEYYTQCKFAINPHRDPRYTGKAFLNLYEGIPCPVFMDTAISPNPRFFDTVAASCVPLNDAYRTECNEFISKYDVNPNESFILPEIDQIDKLVRYVNSYSNTEKYIKQLSKCFIENETYVKRAEQILKRIF